MDYSIVEIKIVNMNILKENILLKLAFFTTLMLGLTASPSNIYASYNDPDKVPDLTVENVKAAIIEAGIQHTEIVLKQAILETGWLKCTKCSLTRNNIFGFYYKKKYISFDNWLDCVDYYKRWQDRHYKGGDYYQFLKDVGYATSPTYVQKLKQIKVH